MPVPLLSSAGEVLGSTGLTKLTEEGVEQLLRAQWQNNNPNAKRKVKRGLEKRFLLTSDVDASKRRPRYASSPILQYMRERCTCPGTVYVAYVPPRMGKTTACVAHIEMYVRKGLNGGLCFSPADSGKPYLQNMLTLLDLKDYSNPPSGLVDLIARELASPAGVPTSYLLLDEFMSKGINPMDEELARSIKTVVRGRNLVAIILTPNEAAANFLLTLNGLEGIQPMLTEAELLKIKSKVGFTIPPDFGINWDKHLSMEWETDELVNAFLMDPNRPKGVSESEVRTFLQDFSQEERKTVSPGLVLSHFSPQLELFPAASLSPVSSSPKRFSVVEHGLRWLHHNVKKLRFRRLFTHYENLCWVEEEFLKYTYSVRVCVCIS